MKYPEDQLSTIKNDIILGLQKYYNSTGKIPHSKNTASCYGFGYGTITKYFGNWNNALMAANIPISVSFEKFNINCKTCGVQLILNSTNLSTNNFCSRSCAAKFNNSVRVHNIETKQKLSRSVSEYHKNHPKFRKYTYICELCERSFQRSKDDCVSICSKNCRKKLNRLKNPKIRNVKNVKLLKLYNLQCLICNNEFIHKFNKTKTCSVQCRNKLNSINMIETLRTGKRRFDGPHKQSYMEKSFEQWLISNGIINGLHGYLMEIHFYNTHAKKNGWIDFVFPKLKLIIELDGSHHKKRKHLDDIRDAYLTTRGWKVVRIPHTEYVKKNRIDEIKLLLHL